MKVHHPLRLPLLLRAWCGGALFIAALMLLAGTGYAYRFSDQLEISGRIDAFGRPAIGTGNPHNAGLVDDKPDLMLLRNRAEFEIFYQPSANLRFFLKPRLQGNYTDNVNDDSRDYDAFPRSFSGNGTLLRGGGDNFQAELREVWGSGTFGNLWLKFGKQTIVWGETVALRVLDLVNPLDLSQNFFFNRAFEEFQETRIPTFAARAVLSMPNATIPDFAIEGFINPGDVVPTILPSQGSPYNPIPSFVELDEDVPRGDVIFGGRVTGTLWRSLALQANFISKPVDDAVPQTVGLRPDPALGIPALAPRTFAPFRILMEGKHPRVEIVGAGGSLQVDPLSAILKLETTYTFDQPFEVGPMSFSRDEKDVWKAIFSIDRPVHVIPRQPALEVAAQYFRQQVLGSTGGLVAGGQPIDKHVEVVTILLRQPLLQKTLTPELLIAYDLDDAYWIQPNIHYEYGNHWRFDLMANFFGGAETRAGRFGFFDFADDVALRVTYGF